MEKALKWDRWCVCKIVCEWQFVEEFGRYLWVEVLHENITPIRELQEDAEEDFARLGFEVKRGDGVVVQCHDDIKHGKKWVRHIVQCSPHF